MDSLRRLVTGIDVCLERLEPAYGILDREDSPTSRSVDRSRSKTG
jgi:hypothetical protein